MLDSLIIRKPAVLGDTLHFVHLSDIHFRPRGPKSSAILDEDIRNELLRDVVPLTRTIGPVTGILVTGDIAFAGGKTEYETAATWLDSLCDALGCEREKVWVIPGNHDVDRNVYDVSTAIQDMHLQLRPPDPNHVDKALDRYLSDPVAANALLSPLSEFNLFARRYRCETTPDQLYWEQPVQLNDGSELRIRGVNSAIVSDRNDHEARNRLILGTRQVVLPRPQPDEDPVEYLFLCHHPPQWLIDQDVVVDYLGRARILLFGHKHRRRTEVVDESLRIFAGAVHPSRDEGGWAPTYNIISIRVEANPRRLIVSVVPRVWDEERTEFRRGSTRGDEPYDRYEFNLPPRPILSTPVGVIDRPAEPPEEREPGLGAVDPPTGSPATGLSRRDVFRFFSLPYQVRLQIALDLALLEAEDEHVEEPEQFRRVLLRVPQRRMTERFVAELDRHSVG